MITDLGGFLKAITIVCFVLNYPMAKYMFYLQMMKKLFFASSTK